MRLLRAIKSALTVCFVLALGIFVVVMICWSAVMLFGDGGGLAALGIIFLVAMVVAEYKYGEG